MLTIWWCPCVESSLCCWKRVFAMTSAFSWLNSVSLCPASFHIHDGMIIHLEPDILECESGKSRNTWSNRQIWPWNAEWSRAKTTRVLPRKCTGHSKHPLPTTQEKTLYMDITRWLTPKSDWLHSLQAKMVKLYTVNKNKTGSWLWLRSWTPYCQIKTEIDESGEKPLDHSGMN